MNKNSMLVRSNFSVNKIIEDNDTRFMQVTIDVLHTGLNYNGSVFTKEVVDSCADSIQNTPIVGFIVYDETTQQNDFKGHEYIVTKTKNGIEEKYIGNAYGVIPQSCNARWVTKMSSDGEEREYFQVDALLWTKFDDCIDIIERDGSKAQSMELEIASAEGTEDDDGIFHFSKFRFNGCCLLGAGVEPAMIDSNITQVQFTLSDFVKQIQSELNDKFTQFTKLEFNKEQGGNEYMPETIDFQTVLNQFEDIRNIVTQHETYQDRWGDTVARYYAVDIQDDEVIVVDRKDGYNFYGCKFTVEGDKPVIDFSTATRKKICYVNYEDSAEQNTETDQTGISTYMVSVEQQSFEKTSKLSEQISAIETEKETISKDYAAVKMQYDEMKPKYDNYVHAEQDRLVAEETAKKNDVFARFENALKDNADYIALKEQFESLSVDDIETKCSVIYTKQNLNFSKKSDTAKVSIMSYDKESEGVVTTPYGDIPVGK